MGYTHYWDVPSPDLSRKKLATANTVSDIKAIVTFAQQKGYTISGHHDELIDPVINGYEVVFNGFEDDSHETFDLLYRQGFNFCKTNRKPYDTVVVAVLAYASEQGLVTDVRSDGTAKEWEKGVQLACEALGRQVPNPILSVEKEEE